MRLNKELHEYAVHIRDFAHAHLPDLGNPHVDIGIQIMEQNCKLEGTKEIIRFVEDEMVGCSLLLLTVAREMGYSVLTGPRHCQ